MGVVNQIMGACMKRRDDGMCMRAADQRRGAVRRRTTCEANKSGGRVLDELCGESDDVRGKVRLYTANYETVAEWNATATL